MSGEKRQFAPSAARNRDPIWAVLQPELPSRGLVLEVASGSGEHTAHFARLSGSPIIFQPSDPDAQARASIDAWAATSERSNTLPALALDAAVDAWPIARRRRRVHQHDSHFAVGFGCWARARFGARATARGTAVPLRSISARRPPHGAEQRSLRCGPAPPQPRMGRARPRSRRRPRNRRRLHAAGRRRDARQQPLRPLPPRRGVNAAEGNRGRVPAGTENGSGRWQRPRIETGTAFSTEFWTQPTNPKDQLK